MNGNTVGRQMEMLLVERNCSDARLTFEFLKQRPRQHRLTWVEDGEEAMEFLHRRGRFAQAPRPDLVLLALELPKKDGWQMLAEMKSDKQLQQIPVVVLTRSSIDERTVKNQLLDVEEYLTKPVDPDRFLSLMQELRTFWVADIIGYRRDARGGQHDGNCSTRELESLRGLVGL